MIFLMLTHWYVTKVRRTTTRSSFNCHYDVDVASKMQWSTLRQITGMGVGSRGKGGKGKGGDLFKIFQQVIVL